MFEHIMHYYGLTMEYMFISTVKTSRRITIEGLSTL